MDLRIGQILWLTHVPFRAQWRVINIIDAGAELEYTGRVEFVGFKRIVHADVGTPLTSSPDHAFLGRAHWPRG
jgi:hypothetical protein